MRVSRLLLPAGLLVFAMSGVALAYEPGDQVVVISDSGPSIEFEGGWAFVGEVGDVYTVAAEEEGRVGLEMGETAWIDSEHVLPLEEALAYFTEKIESDNPSGWAYLGRIRLHGFVGEYEKVLEDLNAVIELEPEEPSWFTARGNEFAEYGDDEAAIADFTQALELTGGDAVNYNNRGNSYVALEQYEQGIEDFTAALALEEGASICHNRALAYKALGDYASTKADYEQALELDPNYIRSVNNLAWLLATCPVEELREGPRALELARQAVEQTGGEASACFDTLAGAFAEMGDYEAAVRAAEHAIEMEAGGPNTAEYAEHLEAYKQGGPYRESPLTEAGTE